MRGKIAFVIGLTVGYIFGTRAGRERYEQIKAGAKSVWDSTLVKQGRDQVGDYFGDVRSNVQESVIRAGREFVDALVAFNRSRNSAAAASAPSSSATATKKPSAKKAAAKSPAAKKPAAKKATTKKPTAATNAEVGETK